MENFSALDSTLSEAIFTFTEVCRTRGYAPEPVLFADLSKLPGIYRSTAGLGWAYRLQDTKKLMAVTEDGDLFWATRTWRLRNQPAWLQNIVGDYFLVAQTLVDTDESRQLQNDIVSGLLRSLERKEQGDGV